MKISRSWKLILAFVTISIAPGCASNDDEFEEMFAQEELEQEEVVQEEPSEDQSQTEVDAETEEDMQPAMSNPNVDPSAEALATELENLASPQPIGGTDSMVNTVSDEESMAMSESAMAEEESEAMSMPDTSGMGSTAAMESLPVVDAAQADYVVQPGDTLARISSIVYGSSGRWNQLAQDNGISDPSLIYPGDVIRYRLEGRSEEFKQVYGSLEKEVIMVQKGDTLEVIAERLFGRKDYWKPMWHMNRNIIPNPNQIKEGQILSYLDPKKIAQTLSDKGLSSYAH